jgi:transcriptional regulator with XRE-family HTH domain
MQDFSQYLRSWRTRRRLSQLDLAMAAEVSARHLSFLESGRSRPSSAMVLKLAEALEMPRADRNRMLTAAGFAPHYPDLGLDEAEMAQVRAAMDWTITRRAPYPALVMDRVWRIVSLNRPAGALLAPFGLGRGASLTDAFCAADGIARQIENWPEVGAHILQRLRLESARAGGIDVLDRAAARLARDPEVAGWTPPARLPAVVPTLFRAGDARLALFSTYAQFGTAEDLALADMKIELMFPADAETERTLKALFADAL